MAEPFISEIRMMSFNFAPKGWAKCDGQLLPLNQNQALFSLLGTTFGGDGRTNVALPDNRGRVPIHVGNGHTLGERAGEANQTLTTAEMPTHTHPLGAVQSGNVAGNLTTTTGNLLASSTPNNIYTNAVVNAVMLNQGNITSAGGNQAHQNMQPYLTINFCIALQGTFPSQS